MTKDRLAELRALCAADRLGGATTDAMIGALHALPEVLDEIESLQADLDSVVDLLDSVGCSHCMVAGKHTHTTAEHDSLADKSADDPAIAVLIRQRDEARRFAVEVSHKNFEAARIIARLRAKAT